MGVQIVNQYNDASRGVFQDASLAKQLVSFEGLKFRGRNGVCNVTPTDIDGLVQLDKEKCFIFFELKHSGAVPYGQATALAKLADFVQAGGANCVVFVAVHNTPREQTIMAKDAIVRDIYWKGKWYSEHKKRTLREIALNFVDFIKEN
jgi:hypothetical protein